ncbi:MAG: hypothetical protein HBSIN02_17940 [Bacteroidia bacterium]|nr:MAG: hypothetical protein HBSIN02_17940 [Bacteroidia bacterium]
MGLPAIDWHDVNVPEEIEDDALSVGADVNGHPSTLTSLEFDLCDRAVGGGNIPDRILLFCRIGGLLSGESEGDEEEKVENGNRVSRIHQDVPDDDENVDRRL